MAWETAAAGGFTIFGRLVSQISTYWPVSFASAELTLKAWLPVPVAKGETSLKEDSALLDVAEEGPELPR